MQTFLNLAYNHSLGVQNREYQGIYVITPFLIPAVWFKNIVFL